MAANAYIVSVAPRSGKSVIALGVMELLARRTRKIGFFRPIIPEGGPDNNIELIRRRYNLPIPYDDMYAFTHDQAQDLASRGNYDELIKVILGRYKALESRCNFVLIEGTDYTGVSTAFEFDINATLAKNLGAPVIVLVNARNKKVSDVSSEVQIAEEAFENQGCTLLATMVNRLNAADMGAVLQKIGANRQGRPPVYVLPNDDLLGKPTVGEIVEALNANHIQCEPDSLNREVQHLVVAAMQLRNFLEHLEEGALIITPGDRADIILGTVATAFSDTYPNIAGIVLPGDLKPEPPIQRLIDGMHSTPVSRVPIPVFSVDTDTYLTAMKAHAVRAALPPDNDRKIATALGLFETHVDLQALEEQIAATRSSRETPFMFEYKLIEKAREKLCATPILGRIIYLTLHRQ
ncbi:MAG: AAA family ATPase, partial [Desulfosarcina sp.]|nr:AAA family ATPase [Desulfobacterales bacterium]